MSENIDAKPPNSEPQLVRSNLLLNADRYVLERDLMCQLEAGGGPLGLAMVDLEQRKRDVCKLDATKSIPRHQDMLAKLEQDGVYVNDPEVNSKFNDINVQKLEERLLNNGQSNFFRMNGELKLDNDLLSDQITRPADFAFEQTKAFQTKEVSAEMSDRMNAKKKKYFRLDVSIGKLELRFCEDLFSEEDLLCLEMRDQYIEYENQVSLAMIPFYQQRREHLVEKIRLEQSKTIRNNDDLLFLNKTLKDIENSLEKEKQEVQRKAQTLYDTWRKISELRQKQQFAQSYAHLKVYKKEENGIVDFSFQFINQNPSEEKDDHTPLPPDVRNRRETIKKVRVYAKLLINGKFVSQTKSVPLTNSYFQAELCEVFQVNLFTMPSSIQLKLYLSRGFTDQLVDTIDVEVPGQHVKTLTCASQLIQELEFSKVANMKRQAPNEKAESEMNVKEKEEKKRRDEEAAKSEIKGKIYVKTVWQGNGPAMPPIKSENLFKKQKAQKNRNQYSLEEEYMILLKQLYIDVNDPRNERIIKIIKEQRNEFFVKLLSDDAKNLLSDSKPFRHKLLELRQRDSSLANLPIPLYENEIVDSSKSTYYLEKLEQMFRDEAYLVHLQARIEDKENGKFDPSQLQITDLETVKRRQIILDDIKNRAQTQSVQKGLVQYKSVVKEEEILSGTNPFAAIIQKFFVGGRKLKPIIKKREPVGVESVSESKLHVHVIKGQNVPLRREFIDQYQSFLGNKNQYTKDSRPRPLSTSQGGANIDDRGKDKEFTQKNDVYKKPQVETYVEVKFISPGFQTVVDRTWCDDGKDPNWNEIKTFIFKSTGEKFTKKSLIEDQTMIMISVFDRQQYSQVMDGKQITQEEHRYIGSVTLPMKTVLQNPEKIDWSFQINRPLVLPSYNVVPDEVYFIEDKAKLDGTELRKNEQIPTYVNISISLEPPLELPSENDQFCFTGYESQQLLTEGTDWLMEHSKRFKHSQLKLFGENIKGESVLLCRYLTPIKPPTEVIDLSRPGDLFAIERVARFVSMIPFRDDLTMFKSMPDMYCTAQEFLDLGAGDYEEHAILLANYFQYIDDHQTPGKYQSYIILGTAMPEGNSVYVMRQKTQEVAAQEQDYSVEIWKPMTGDCYFFAHKKNFDTGLCSSTPPSYVQTRFNDPICPLRAIHAVVSSTNVWANIQKHDSPQTVSFNLLDSKAWNPFFDKPVKIQRLLGVDKIATYQNLIGVDELIYAKPITNIESLESRVQKYIIEMFQDERIKTVRKTTKWKFDAQSELRIILINCEKQVTMARKGGRASTFQSIGVNTNTELDLEQIQKRFDALANEDNNNRRVWGFPINCTFTSLDNLWKNVEVTKVHMVNRHDVEFGISVYIEPYPANVLSVWVYLAAFVDKSLPELAQM